MSAGRADPPSAGRAGRRDSLGRPKRFIAPGVTPVAPNRRPLSSMPAPRAEALAD